MCLLISAAERASTSSRSSDALTSSPISASVASTSAEVSVAAFSASVPVCVSWGFIEALIIAGGQHRQDARFAYVEKFATAKISRIFAAFFQICGASARFRAGPQRKHADIGHIPVSLGVIESISDNELVRNRKSDIVRVHGSDPPLRLIQQNRNPNTLRLALLKYPQQILQRHSSVENVFHNDHRFALDARIEIARQPHLARRVRARTVARHRDEVE